MYPVQLRRVVWSRDAAGNAKVRRTGFPLVPAFSGTAHSFTGATLDQAIVDCLDYRCTPKREDMAKSYVCIPRVRKADDLLIAQEFAPSLFRQGMMVGPQLLLQRLRGEISQNEVQEAWEKADADYAKIERKFVLQLWKCGQCGRMLPADQYGASSEPARIRDAVLSKGMWRRCISCVSGDKPQCVPRKLAEPVEDMRKQLGVKCMSCGRVQRSALYNSAKLRGWLENGRLMDAVCLQCTPPVASTAWTRQKAHLCHTCNQMKPLDSFSAATQKRSPATRTWHCLDCSQPICIRCNRRPEKPLRGCHKTHRYCCICVCALSQALLQWRLWSPPLEGLSATH